MTTTHLLTKQVGNANLDNVFDPYIQGTSPPDTGLLDDSGVDIASNRFAPIVYGAAAAATGLETKQAGNSDVSTLFAAKGTASYSIAIDGQRYTSAINIGTAGTGSSTIRFEITSGIWNVYASNSQGGAASLLASGSIPGTAATVQYTWGTYVVATGDLDAGGSTTNAAATATVVGNNPSASYTTATNNSTSGSRDREYPFTVDFFASSGENISHSVCTLIGVTEGSV